VVDGADRADGVTTIATGSVDSVELARICRERAGLTLGSGISGAPGTSFRIGHMGHVNAPMILGVLGTIEAALAAMSAPVGGSGVAAAATSMGGAIAP
jgi:alanine-glyoxylate transaminase/serine-glyoxylate transaminase/serine-pyruvate transaminase